jgi:hypothetical protein
MAVAALGIGAGSGADTLRGVTSLRRVQHLFEKRTVGASDANIQVVAT